MSCAVPHLCRNWLLVDHSAIPAGLHCSGPIETNRAQFILQYRVLLTFCVFLAPLLDWQFDFQGVTAGFGHTERRKNIVLGLSACHLFPDDATEERWGTALSSPLTYCLLTVFLRGLKWGKEDTAQEREGRPSSE